jgi:hypothetical protein
VIRTALAGLLALPLVASAADPAPKAGTPLEFVVLPDGAPARLEVRIEVDGKPLSAVWDDTFAKLTAYFDRDGNGSLDEKEAARLPDPVALRQSIGTGFTPPIGVSPTFTELDTDNNGKVTPGEVAAYYKKAGCRTGRN